LAEVRITVLGKSPSWQDADGACSGYLVQEGDTALLVDCGSGVLAKLRRFVDYVDLDAIVISHLHADHILDLVPYACALTYAPRQQPVPVDRWPGTDAPARPALHVPPGGGAALAGVCAALGAEDLIANAFDVRDYEPARALEVGPLRVRFAEVPHFTTTYALEVSAGGGRFTYGADSRPNDELVELARGTELLMLEATLPRPEREGPRGHMTPAEAGEQAARVAAGRLVLTHISDELDQERARAEAAETFGGPVEVAREGATYEV
jgi:ribonuclease BN (tRNA processing enzyme)